MDSLTALIDNYNYNNHEIITHDSIYETLWQPLNQLLHDPNKEALIEGWKYKTELISVENCHSNGHFEFTQLSWEKSFTLSFWMSIYH
jgi:hypothetical protein